MPRNVSVVAYLLRLRLRENRLKRRRVVTVVIAVCRRLASAAGCSRDDDEDKSIRKHREMTYCSITNCKCRWRL